MMRKRLEASKDDYRIRCEELEKEILELRQQNEDLTRLADEAQSLKDEMDVLRHSSDKVTKLESQVESCKKKLEDLGDLRRQVKLLEEKNTIYMQNTVSLEEELRKANAARSQMETYKRQVFKHLVYLKKKGGGTVALDFCMHQVLIFLYRLLNYKTDSQKNLKKLTNGNLNTKDLKKKLTAYKKKRM
ncbi:hypothetical protein FKM82_021459 [Ascaphus truei]